MKKVLLHFGYPKTATTSLQNNVFSQLHSNNTINFLGRSAVFHNQEIAPRELFYPIWRILKSLMELDDKDFMKLLPEYRTLLETTYLVEDKLNVISEELLSETLILPTYSRSAARNLRRLELLFSGYEVCPVVVIRNQKTAIYSMFVEWYPRHFAGAHTGYDSFKQYLQGEAGSASQSCLTMFDYYSFYQAVVHHFSDCHVVPYELVLEGAQEYAAFWAGLLSVDSSMVEEMMNRARQNEKIQEDDGYYARSTTASNYIARMVNSNRALVSLKNKTYLSSNFLEKFWRRFARPLLDKVSTGQELIPFPDSEDIALIEMLFQQNNHLLAQQTGLDLSRFEYPVQRMQDQSNLS